MIEVIGKAEDGRLIAKIDVRVMDLLDVGGTAFNAVIDPILALLRAALPKQETKTPAEEKPAVEKPKRKYTKRAKKAAAPARTAWNKFPAQVIEREDRFKHSKVNRNKKCRECGDSFFDESLRARRVFCGEGGCKKEALKKKGRTPRDLDDGIPPKPIMGM